MIQFIDALNANSWLGFLLNVTMKSLVIFAVAGVLAFLLRGKSAALRSLIWHMSILGCLMVSVFSLTLSPLEIGVLPGNPVGFEAEVPLENNRPAAVTVPVAPRPLPTTAASSPHVISSPVAPEPETGDSGAFQSNRSRTAFVSLHWTNWVVLIWAAGGLFLLARLVVGIGGVWRITARSNDFSGSNRDLQLGLRVGSWRRPVRIRRSDEVTAPIMWGLLRPTILLPTDADSWREDRLRAVLLHELAHVRRNDWESRLIAQMMCVVYWFNPLVWFAARRMQVEAEQACDDYVLNMGYKSTDYAQHLIEIVRTAKIAGSFSRAAVAIGCSSKIEERVRMILAENLNRRPLTKVSLVSGYCIVIFFTMQLGAMRLAEAKVSLETVLEGLRFAQTEVTSGELEIIYKRNTVPRISRAEARSKSQTVIHEMEKRFSELPLEVQNRPRYRTNHERNIQLSRQYMPQLLAGEEQLHEKWNVAFELAYINAKTKVRIFAYRFTRKNVKEYATADAAEFYGASDEVTFNSDGIHEQVSHSSAVARLRLPLVVEGGMWHLLGRWQRWQGIDLQAANIETLSPIKNSHGEYVLTFQTGIERKRYEKVTIDVEKGFGIKRMESFSSPDAELPETVIEFLDYQLSSDIWHPRKITRVDYWMKEGVRRIRNTEEWEIRKVLLNTSFAEDYFQLDDRLLQTRKSHPFRQNVLRTAQ